jgi:ABC-2 type transport system ATP-binding protein
VTTALEAQGVSKRYGSVAALVDLTFGVEAGEVLGVLGPNGAGKTTAIRILTTILQADRGSFSVAGVPHKRPEEIRRVVGVLPESSGYPSTQTGAEYLRYFARLYGHSREGARALADSLLAQVGLAERARSQIATYSRGMRQRLGIARTLVNDPQVVFLDEPTLGLDPAGQRQVLGLIRGIAAERGATVVLSTHLLAEVEEICTRVLILNHGRVAAQGTVSEIVRRAAAPRSARLRVGEEYAEQARATLAAAAGIESVEFAEGLRGSLTATLADGDGHAVMNDGLRALADAGIPVLSFEVEGSRLSDAFLSMTEGS